MQQTATPLAFNYRLMHISSGDLWAGAEVQMYNLIESLAKHHCQTRVILFNRGLLEAKLQAANIPVDILDERHMSGISLLIGVRKLLREHKPDIIHTHGYKENILASLANLTTLRAKSLRTVHGDTEFKTSFWKPHRKLQYLLNHLSGNYLQQAIIAVSPALADILKKRHPANKIHILENAINIQAVIDSALQAPTPAYAKETFNIACIGRLVPLKRQDILITLMPDLLKQVERPVHLFLFGDGPERARLKALVKDYQVEQHVTLTGSITPLYPHMQQMDLIVMPSDHEGLPMTLLEALALQRPIVAHAAGGIPHVLNNGEFGKLVTMHTTKGYLDAILDVIQTPQASQVRALLGLEHLKNRYAIDTQVHQYDQLYRQLLSSNV